MLFMDFMGKSRNEMAIVNSKLLVITRGYLSEPTLVTSGKRFHFAIENGPVEIVDLPIDKWWCSVLTH